MAAIAPAAAQPAPAAAPRPATDSARAAAEPGEVFIAVSAGTAFYSAESAAFGGGLAAGYGFDIGAIGVTMDYLVDPEGLTTLAPGLFARFYLPLVSKALPLRSGPFLQLGFGPTFHTGTPRIPPAAVTASVSAGVSAGWRFPVGDRWYVEPTLRAGYPFLTGAAVSAGYRF
jgi:hypothetical protein